MKLKVYTPDASNSSEKEFERFPRFDDAKGRDVLRQVILAYQANRRQGNASTKTRAEVSGTGKKPFRQKGTGMARQGTRRATQHTGGGIAFGPKPRDYSQKINKKMRRLALSRALFDRASDGELAVIEKWEVSEPKTRLISDVITRIAPRGKVLLVDDAFDDNTTLASRNIPRVTLTDSSSINSWDLVSFDHIILSENGINTVIARITGGNQE